MNTKNQFPKYLSTSPYGEDLLDGKSQEKIATAIGLHIKDVDSHTSQKKPIDVPMPKIIGLEGSWGSGKSNVVTLLRKKILSPNDYYFFEYDAWSHQEDLQRRSILQKLTHELVKEKVLRGLTTADTPSLQEDGSIKSEKKVVTWEEKLEILMSKKVSTLSKVSKVVYGEFKAFVLLLALTPILTTLANVLKPSFTQGGFITYECWVAIVVSLFVLLYAIFFLVVWCNYDINHIWSMYADSSKEEKDSFQIIHSAEPSLGEFSKWMSEISASLATSKKVVVVFDNMDRLPKEKVKQLWSAIHSLFSDGSLKNIWCIIPYDFKHLATAFGEDEGQSEMLAKYFIEKSFPIVYRVPAPVVIDYKEIFDKFFFMAFGNSVSVDDQDKINRSYRVVNANPNIREIIAFINKCVSLKKTFDGISIIAVALYALRENEIIYHPRVIVKPDKDNAEGVIKDTTTDNYMLCYEFLNNIDSIVDKTPTLLKEVAALVYGIDPERAYQLAIMQAMKECFTNTSSTVNLNKFISNELFFSSLVEVINGLEVNNHPLIVKRLSSLEADTLTTEQTEVLNGIWTSLALSYKGSRKDVNALSEYEKMLMVHASDTDSKTVASQFATLLMDNPANTGGVIFNNLLELENEKAAEKWNMKDVVPAKELSTEKFVEYLLEGELLYKNYPISCNSEELNKFFHEQMIKEELALHAVALLKDEDNYNVSVLADDALNLFKEEKSTLRGALTCLSVIHLFKKTCDVNPSEEFSKKLWTEAEKLDTDSDDYAEIYVLTLLYHPVLLGSGEQVVSKEMAQKAMSYKPIAGLLKNCLTYNGSLGYKRLLETIVLEKLSDESSLEDFVSMWHDLVSMSKLTRANMFEYADVWHYYSLGKVDSEKTIKDLLPDTEWLNALFESSSTIAHELTTKLVEELKAQPTTYFNETNLTVSAPSNYWYQAFIGLMKISAITTPYGEKLDNLVINVLKYVSKGNSLDNSNYLLWLLERADKKTVASDMNEIVRKMLTGQTYQVTKTTFPIFHEWLEYSGIHNDMNKTAAADIVLAPVVDNEPCQEIILKNKEYYEPIIAIAKEHSSNLYKKLKEIINSKPDGEFAEYITSITNYEDEKDS